MKQERFLVAVADGKALALTGPARGEVWVVDSSPGDGLWVIDSVREVSWQEARWRTWTRPADAEIAAYQSLTLSMTRR